MAGAFVAPRWNDVLLAWSDAADDAHSAYRAWCAADRAGRDDAFVVFFAALDREEAAACALEAQTTTTA